MCKAESARYCHRYKMSDTIIAFIILRILMYLRPFQKVSMYIVSFALILAVSYMGGFMFSIWQMNMNTVLTLANYSDQEGKGRTWPEHLLHLRCSVFI